MMFPDPLALIIDGLLGQFDGVWVGTELPDPVESDLPAVWVNPLPGSGLNIPWNESAPLTDAPSFDVDVFASANDGLKELNDFAAQVREALFRIPALDRRVKRVIEDVPLAKRPDWNPKVLRVGGEYALIISRR